MIPRIIPCLLLQDGALVKTVGFSNPAYIGDPRNAILIFNEKEVDELMFLDIVATKRKREPDFSLIERLASECFMPIAYGGGVSSLEQMRRILRGGVEKIVLNAAAISNASLVREASLEFGSQAVVVSIDAREAGSGEWTVATHGAEVDTGRHPVEFALAMQEAGAGEILLTSVVRDGTMTGYDLGLTRQVASALDIPLIANGGAGSLEDCAQVMRHSGARACAVGSLFVYYGGNRAVLISYPSLAERRRAFDMPDTRSPFAVQSHDLMSPLSTKEGPSQGQGGRRVCTRCLYGTHNVPIISFDERGVCNYCRTLDQLEREYPRGNEGWRILEGIAERIRRAGQGHRYDVAVGVSGGCDSSYLLVLAKQLGLRPLAVHFDNTWNSRIAVENIQRVLSRLKVDLHTYVVNNDEYDDIYRAFLAAGTPDAEAPTDLGLAVVLNKVCEQFGIRYIFEGHSYRTEGICPLGWLYMDGRYIREVHRRFGRLPMRTYPNMPLSSFLRWTIAKRLVKIRPLYYLDYQKEPTKEMLAREFDWQWYGGHHLENRFTAFFHTYFWPRRWGIDGRLLGHCALVWSGQMQRAQAAQELDRSPVYDPRLVEYVRTRLGYTVAQWEEIMTLPKRTYSDYPNYKATFERLRPLFWMLYKMHRVPKSFYLKYCLPYRGAEFRGHTPSWGAPVAAAAVEDL